MKLLSLDPSSMLTGYAVMAGPAALLEAGLIRPKKRSGPAMVRIDDMVADLEKLITDHNPDVVLVEVTSGKVNTKRHTGAGAGLGVYGMAAGAMRQAARGVMVALGSRIESVIAVEENVWTRGVGKRARQAAIAALFPAYAASIDQDGGMDMADAIGLGVWWYQEQAVVG